MLIKQKSLSFPRNLALATSGELLIVFSTNTVSTQSEFSDFLDFVRILKFSQDIHDKVVILLKVMIKSRVFGLLEIFFVALLSTGHYMKRSGKYIFKKLLISVTDYKMTLKNGYTMIFRSLSNLAFY